MTLLRCVDNAESKRLMTEVHEGVCGTHANGNMLARKILTLEPVTSGLPWKLTV